MTTATPKPKPEAPKSDDSSDVGNSVKQQVFVAVVAALAAKGTPATEAVALAKEYAAIAEKVFS